MITLVQGLDRERQKIYEIRIEAHDLGVPTSLSSDLDLRIYVKNVNDHEPEFLVKEFSANFTENTQPGRERVKIIGNFLCRYLSIFLLALVYICPSLSILVYL